MNSPVLGPATVKLSGGLYRQGEGFPMAKLTFLGNSPNATVKLFRWEQDNHGKDKFVEHDLLRNATVIEDRADTNKLTISGISQMAKDDGVGFEDSDCMVTWDVMLTGSCSDCG